MKQRANISTSIIVSTLFLSVVSPLTPCSQQESSNKPSPAAQGQKEPAAAPVASPTLQSIPQLIEIASGLDELTRQLQEIKRRLANDSERQNTQQSLDTLSSELDTRSQHVHEALQALPTLGELQDLASEWSGLDRRLATFQNTLTNDAAVLNRDIAWLNTQQEKWSKVLVQIQSDPSLAELQVRISQSISELQNSKTLAEDQLKAIVTLQTRALERRQLIASVLERINSESKLVQRGLFQPDASPLWQVAARRESDPGLRRVLRTQYGRDWARLREFVSDKRTPLFLALLIAIGTTVGAIKMKRRLPHWVETGIVNPRLVHTFERPYALGAFAGLLATIPLMLNAPAAVKGLISLFLIIPVLRLIGPLTKRIDVALLYILLGANVLVVIIKIATVSVLWKRNLLALLSLGIAFVGVWLSRRMREADGTGFGRSITILAVRVGAILMFASFAANLFGYFALSQVLTEGTLFGAYYAVSFYAARQVCLTLISTLVKTESAKTLAVVRQYHATIEKWSAFLLTLLAWLVWLTATLKLFAVRDDLYEVGRDVVTKPLGSGETSFTVADVFVFLLVLVIGLVVSTGFRVVLREDVLKRLHVRQGVPFAVSTMTYYVMLFFVFMLALIAAGVQLSKFTLFTGAFGIGVGFGLQNTINNFASGIVLLLERPIRENDILEVEGVFGEVTRIGMRSTSIRTAEEAEVIVPNSVLVAGKVINWSRLGRRRPVEIPMKVAYGPNPEEIIDLLVKTASSHADVLRDPAPAAFLQTFGENALEFVLVFWVGRYRLHRKVLSEVAIGITNAFAEAGIQIHKPAAPAVAKTEVDQLDHAPS